MSASKKPRSSTSSSTASLNSTSPSASANSSIAIPTSDGLTPTFAVPQASGGPFGGPGADGGQGGQGGPGDNTLQSSANLYLYTFLATLVLLLGVSAAIVIRSLLLRRRHRRMIEDAIRNGTWIPHHGGGGGGGGGRRGVDLSKKPKMFEVFLGPAPGLQQEGSGGRDAITTTESEKGKISMVPSQGHTVSSEHHEWDMIVPFAVSQPPTTSTSTSSALLSSDASTNSSTSTSPRGTPSGLFNILMSRFIPGATLSPNPQSTNTPTATSDTSPADRDPTNPNFNNSTSIPLTPLKSKHPTSSGFNLSNSTGSGPLQVAVLIAMPSQIPLTQIIEQSKRKGNDEDELPYVEVGLTVVDIVDGKGEGEADEADITVVGVSGPNDGHGEKNAGGKLRHSEDTEDLPSVGALTLPHISRAVSRTQLPQVSVGSS